MSETLYKMDLCNLFIINHKVGQDLKRSNQMSNLKGALCLQLLQTDSSLPPNNVSVHDRNKSEIIKDVSSSEHDILLGIVESSNIV